MEISWKWFVSIALAWQFAFALGKAQTADEGARDLITRIASSDKETRQRGLDEVGANREGQLLSFLEAFQLGQIYRYQKQVVWCPALQTVEGKSIAPLSDPLTGEELQVDGARQVVAKSELEAVGPRRRERRLIMNLVRMLQLFSSDDDVRLAAAVKVGSVRKIEVLADLELALERETDAKIQHVMRESRSLIQLGAPVDEVSDEIRLEAARNLGTLCSARGGALLKELLQKAEKAENGAASVLSAIQLDVYQRSLDAIESYQLRVRWLGYVFSGLSLGSVLVLMALGLSVIFGQMGVINMAHGELMMVGAYTTYGMQWLSGHSLPKVC